MITDQKAQRVNMEVPTVVIQTILSQYQYLVKNIVISEDISKNQDIYFVFKVLLLIPVINICH